MRRVRQLLVLAAACGVVACAAVGMNSIKKANQLSVGMDREQVVQILGEPSSTEVKGNQTVLKYTLHQNWKGFVPYYCVFDNDTGRLVAWYEDEEEYQRNQQQIAQAMAPLLEKQQQQQAGAAAPAGPNDPDLQRWITGTYYYFSSSMVVSASSERTFVLCVNGQFRITGEFSASESGAWGAASRSGNAGRWSISGDRNTGTISLSFAGGATRNVTYRVDSKEQQTMLFDGVRFAYAGVAECR
jgi:outer membrane protein assembly factor BamE (lipoprotein component of BamABCDE complex)